MLRPRTCVQSIVSTEAFIRETRRPAWPILVAGVGVTLALASIAFFLTWTALRRTRNQWEEQQRRLLRMRAARAALGMRAGMLRIARPCAAMCGKPL